MIKFNYLSYKFLLIVKLFTCENIMLCHLPLLENRYVRVGNGNQLIRDPKTVSRALASEKVRWSLHTLRCGQVKKQKYCQLFTRFGKCDKEDGRCPYNHDSEKVAIYKQFLKATCSNMHCRLTHKVYSKDKYTCISYILYMGIMNHFIFLSSSR
jgi:hypothetical protein